LKEVGWFLVPTSFRLVVKIYATLNKENREQKIGFTHLIVEK
jgi:hypothetical protein